MTCKSHLADRTSATPPVTFQWLRNKDVRFYSFRCQFGFAGSRCQFPDPCISSPCLSGGTCRAVTKGNTVDFSCACRLGYTDRRCQTQINNACIGSPCQNGGVCESESPQTFKCRCPPGWTGNNFRSRAAITSWLPCHGKTVIVK